jgi:hypothetical protein
MVHLISVHDEFHARVIAARLGSDGIVTELRPPLGGPYPLQAEVRVYVGEGDLSLAQQLLLADQAEEPTLADASSEPEAVNAPMSPSLVRPVRVAVVVLLLVTLLVLALNQAG